MNEFNLDEMLNTIELTEEELQELDLAILDKELDFE